MLGASQLLSSGVPGPREAGGGTEESRQSLSAAAPWPTVPEGRSRRLQLWSSFNSRLHAGSAFVLL